MASWYAPLVLPFTLVPLPQYYQSKIPLFDEISSTNAQQHVDRMDYYFDHQ